RHRPLGTRDKRSRCRCCAKQCDEIASPHCHSRGWDTAAYRLKPLYWKKVTSALPPKADIGTQSWNVRFVPIADIGCRHLTWLRPSEIRCDGSLLFPNRDRSRAQP